LNAQQLADKLHQITPSEYYEITGWTPDTPAAAPQEPAEPPAAAPAPTPAPVAPVAAEEPPVIVDEFGNVDPASKIAKRQQGFEPVFNPMNYPLPGDKGGFGFGQLFGVVLAIASLAVPGLGEIVGAAILDSLGVVGATAAVEAGVGAAALSAGSVAAQGGNAEDILKGAATAGFASGINVGMGGGVTGAATGSFVGSAIQGGGVDQVLINAVAAGAGAGVQGVLGPAAGTITRDLIKTGEVSDQTLIKAAAAEIGAFNKPGDRSAPIVEGQPMTPPAEAEPVPTTISLDPTTETAAAAAAPENATATLPPVTVTAPTIAPTVTDVDVMKQIQTQQQAVPETIAPSTPPTLTEPAAALTPETTPELEKVTVSAPSEPDVSPVVTDLDLIKQVSQQDPSIVTPQQLEQVIIQGQGANVANVAPVETALTSEAAPAGVTTTLDPVTITGKKEEPVAPVATDIVEPRPDTTRGLPAPTAQLDPVTITGKREEEVAPTVTELPPVTVTGQREPTVEFPQVTITGQKEPTYELPQVTVTGQREPTYELDPVTITGQREPVYELDPVTITAKREEEVAPTVTELDPVTITGQKEPTYELDPVTITAKRDEEIAPTVTELDPVTVTAKREEEPAPTITDIVAQTMEPPVSPPPPAAPEVKAEEPKKEEPKKEEPKKLYPTVTSVPPPKKPRAPPIITGASPARLLADALAAYRPAGAIEGEESGKERQNVWNEKSLRLKDALGL
jgi:hypothetical protein